MARLLKILTLCLVMSFTLNIESSVAKDKGDEKAQAAQAKSKEKNKEKIEKVKGPHEDKAQKGHKPAKEKEKKELKSWPAHVKACAHANKGVNIFKCIFNGDDPDDETPATPPKAYFKYFIDFENPTSVSFEFASHAFDNASIIEASYKIHLPTGPYTINLNNFTAKSYTDFEFDERSFYVVELTVKDSNNLTSTYSTTLDLTLDAQAPVVEFSVKQVAPRKIFIDLNDSSPVHEDFNGGMVFFGDGNSQELESLFMTYEYAQAGIYEVRVELTNLADQSGQKTKSITVTDEEVELSAPIADFFIEELDFADGFRLYFAESGSPNGEIVDFSWSFGDGQTGTGEEAIHFYEPGVYDVTLTVTDELGLSGSQTQRIVVHGGAPFIAKLDCWAQEGAAQCEWSVLDSTKSLSSISIDWGNGIFIEQPIYNSEYELFREAGYQYLSSGNYEIELRVTNSSGSSMSSFQQVMVFIEGDEGGEPPVDDEEDEIFECQIAILAIECQSNIAVGDSYEWYLNGVLVGQNNILEASFLSRGEYEVKHVVRISALESKEQVVMIFVPEEDEDYITGELLCRKSGLFRVDCYLSSEENGTAYNYTWVVEDQIVPTLEDFENTVSYEFSGVGSKSIQVTVANEYMQKEFNTVVEIEYNLPLANFTYLLTESGEVEFDARASLDQDRHVASYVWSIEGSSSEYTSTYPVLSFDLSEVNQKNISLKVVDDLGATSVVSQYINFDPSLSNPVAQIVIDQFQGAAGFKVNFQGSSSYDPNDQDLSYEWIINDELINIADHQYIFPSEGTYVVGLKVTNTAGRTDYVEEQIEIDEFKIDRYWQNSYKPAEPFIVFFENYRPEGVPVLQINGMQVNLVSVGESMWSILYPFSEPGQVLNIKVLVDSFMQEKDFETSNYSFSNNPIEETKQIIEEMKSTMQEVAVGEDLGELESYLVEMDESLDYLVNEVENINDENLSKYFHYMLSLLVLDNEGDVVTSYSTPTFKNRVFKSFLDFLIPTANAALQESEVYTRARSCQSRFGNSKLIKSTISLVATSKDHALVIAGLSLFVPGGQAGALVSAGTALALAAGELLVRIPALLQYRNSVRFCLQDVRFPFVGGQDKIHLRFSDPAVTYESGIPVLKSGTSYKANLEVPLTDYFEVNGYVTSSPMYRFIKSHLNLYEDLVSEFSTTIFETAISIATTGPAGVVTSGVTTALNTIVFLGADIQANKVIEEIRNSSLRQGGVRDTMVADKGLFSAANPASTLKFFNNTDGNSVIAFSRSKKENIFAFTTEWSKTGNFFRNVLQASADLRLKIIPFCNGERIKTHPNGGGAVSWSSVVSPSVVVGSEASVCGASRVAGETRIQDRSIVENSTVLGCENLFLGDSVISNGAVVRNGVIGTNVQIVNASVLGSSLCGELGGEVTLVDTIVANDARVETSTRGLNSMGRSGTFVGDYIISGDVLIRDSHLGGSGTIIDSSFYGSTRIVDSSVSHNYNFRMIGGLMERVAFIAEDVRKMHNLRVAGGVNIKDSSIILTDNKEASEIVRGVIGELTINELSVFAPHFQISGGSSINNVDLTAVDSKGQQQDSKVNILKNVNLSDVKLRDASLDSGVNIDGANKEISSSHIGAASNITSSTISSSSIGSGATIIGSNIASSSVGGGGSIIRSVLFKAITSFGIQVIDSEILDVRIDTNKNDNYCDEENVNLPEYSGEENSVPNYCKVSRNAD